MQKYKKYVKYARRFIWILTIAYMGVIFFMSSRSIDQSREDSARLMAAIGIVDSVEEATDVNNTYMMRLQNTVRKHAHFIIFGGLGVLIYLSIYGYAGNSLRTAIKAWILTTFYGATDEFHQIFTNRGASIDDVILNSQGAATAIVILFVIFFILEKKAVIGDNATVSDSMSK